MTEKSTAAVFHVLKQIQCNPKLTYRMGPFTESYRLLTEAAADVLGCPVEEYRRKYEETLPDGER